MPQIYDMGPTALLFESLCLTLSTQAFIQRNHLLFQRYRLRSPCNRPLRPRGGVEIYSSTLPLTSELDWGERSTPRPGRFAAGYDTVLIL